MRIFEFNSDETGYESDESITQYIEANCQPWLNATNNGRLIVYRGTSIERDGYVTRVKQDRIPRDTEPERHAAFNAMIKAVGGIANRSNSAFVSSKVHIASDYGRPYVCIPIGKFNYTWSTMWSDWTAHISGSVYFRYMYLQAFRTDERIAKAKKQLDTYIENLKIHQSNGGYFSNQLQRLSYAKEYQDRLVDYIGTNMMAYEHDEYIRITTDSNSYAANALSEVIKVDRGLDNAIKSGHEIMMSCDHVLLLSPDRYDDVIPKVWKTIL